MKKLYVILLLCNIVFAAVNAQVENPSILASLKAQYDRVEFVKGFYRVYKDGKYGIANNNGNIIIPPTKYTYVRPDVEKDVVLGFRVEIGKKGGYCDVDGKEIIKPDKYDDVSKLIIHEKTEPPTIFYRTKNSNNKQGICDSSGKEIISPKYSHISLEGPQYFAVTQGTIENEPYGIYDFSGKEIISPKYSYIEFNEEHQYFEVWQGKINKGGLCGICDISGKEIMSPKYSFMMSSTLAPENYLDVWQGGTVGEGLCGVYDLLLKEEIIPCIHKTMLFHENWNCFEGIIGNGAIVYNEHGQKLFEAKNRDDIVGVSEGLLCCKFSNGSYGYIDINDGKVVISPEYSSAECFADGTAKISKGSTSYLISNPLANGGGKGLATLSLTEGVKSDVDINIPETGKSNDNTFVVIIANQNYTNFVTPCAIRDGSTFKEYCIKTLGIPQSNIQYFEDATLNNLHSAISRLKDIAEVYEGEAKIIVYYAGQGITDDKNKDAYMLFFDSDINAVTSTGYALSKLYEEISGLDAASSLVLLDVGFDGNDRTGESIASARGVALKHREVPSKGNVVALCATSTGDNALLYKDKQHGLFTYFLLKKLQETQGNVNVKDLSDYVTKNVKQVSTMEMEKSQTPSVATLIDINNLNF